MGDAPDRILAGIDASPAAQNVVRSAKRLADRLQAPWEVVNVATPGLDRAPKKARAALLEAFRLAEELGAQTRSLAGDDPAAELLAYAREQNATRLVVAGVSRPLWIELFRGSFIARLVRGAGDIAIEIAPREAKKAGAAFGEAARLPPLGDPGGYAAAAVFVALAAACAVTIDQGLKLPNISLVFVLAIIAAAVRYGMAVSIFAAIVSALAYNFFLIPPLHTFTIADPSNVYAVLLFTAIGAAVSGVAARTRAQTLIARRQARRSADLEAFARSLVGMEEESDIAAVTAETASKLLFARVVILAAHNGELALAAEEPGPEMLDVSDMAAAKWAFENRREAGRGSDTLSGARWLFLPAPGERGFVGVIGVRPYEDTSRLDPSERRTLDLIAAQAGVALDRARFQREAADARVEAETERLKGTLLSSVSHDLRTPLATIRGAIESLQQFSDRHDEQTKAELLQIAVSEVHRLNRFIENLLDMSRIDAGVIRPKKIAMEAADLLDAALDRAHAALAAKTIAKDVSPGLPRVIVDPALAEAALVNVLENAGKYAPEASLVQVRAYRSNRGVAIEVLDEGPGFPEGAIARLFDKFARGVEGDGRPPGAGLGLAIASGFLSAQGGAIEAANRAGRAGAAVTVLLPIEGG